MATTESDAWVAFAREFAAWLEIEPERELRREDRLTEDLGLDSIARFEIVLLLEERGGSVLDESFLEHVSTVGDVFELLGQFRSLR